MVKLIYLHIKCRIQVNQVVAAGQDDSWSFSSSWFVKYFNLINLIILTFSPGTTVQLSLGRFIHPPECDLGCQESCINQPGFGNFEKWKRDGLCGTICHCRQFITFTITKTGSCRGLLVKQSWDCLKYCKPHEILGCYKGKCICRDFHIGRCYCIETAS